MVFIRNMFLIPVCLGEGYKMMVVSANFIGSSEFYSIEDGVDKNPEDKEIRKPYGYNFTKSD
jgi:hypothetical protein